MDPWRTALLAKAFAPVPTSQHSLHVPPNLKAAEYILICHDAHRGPLRPLYDSSFCILEAGDKAFLVDIGGKPDYSTFPCMPQTGPGSGPTHQVGPASAVGSSSIRCSITAPLTSLGPHQLHFGLPQ
ncbi:hypothetical protein LDENG_00126300 [Lucifuga dentata]|nr:hypothetical protein LDENG_00126300 [Lucifuga dentata]